MMGYRKNRKYGWISYKGFIAWFLTLAMLLDCIPMSALAEEPYYAEEAQETFQEDVQEAYQEAFQEDDQEEYQEAFQEDNQEAFQEDDQEVFQEDYSDDLFSDLDIDDSFEENNADEVWQDDDLYIEDGIDIGIEDDSFQDDDLYIDDGIDAGIEDDSWQDEIYSDDSFDENGSDALLESDDDQFIIDYLSDSDMSYTALWEEEERETAEIVEDPEAKVLIYNGEPQTLIVPGTAAGGTFLYALGEFMDVAPEYGYSEELPVATDAGEYYVWYYAEGDEQHADSRPVCLAYPAVIRKKEAVVTALDQAVRQGEEPDRSLDRVAFTGAAPDHYLYNVTLTCGTTDECGMTSISPGDAIIIDESGYDVTRNYEISYQDGRLTVKGNLVCVRQNHDGTWPESARDSSLVVSRVDAELFEEEHYTLKGYSMEYDSDGSCIPFSPEQEIEELTTEGNVYLYYALENHTLTFYADTEGSEVLWEDTVYYGTSLSSYRDFEPPAREHGTFAAWATESLSNIHYYTEKDEVSLNPILEGKLVDWDSLVLTEDMDVYPVWINDRLQVHIDLGAEDVSLDEEQATSFTVNLDEKIVMRYLAAAARPGYELAGYYTQGGVLWNGEDWKNLLYEQEGWNESAGWDVTPEYCDRDADGWDIIRFNEARKFKYYTVTLTARWTPVPVSIVYDPGEGSGMVTDPVTYGLGDIVTVSMDTPAAPEHKTFIGWKIGTGDMICGPGGSFVLDDWSEVRDNALTLTAQYIDTPMAAISFDSDGGLAVAPVNVEEGTLIEEMPFTAKEGYEFEGWYDGDTRVDFPYEVTDAKVFMARWKVKQYTITFDSAGGSEVEPVTQDYGSVVEAYAEPEKEHYTFAGWEPRLPETMPAQNLTVRAVWTPLRYKLSFDTDGGSEVADIEDIYGAVVTAPQNPTKEGYLFAGWMDENNEQAAIPAYMPDTNPTYTALWEKEPAWIDEVPNPKKLSYNGEPQILIDAGSVSGGTLMYALSDGADTAPESGYSEELPAGTDAGYYYVWYYAKGDETHADSVPACIAEPAVIAKKEAAVTASVQYTEKGETPDLSTDKAYLIGTAPEHVLSDVVLTVRSTDQAGKGHIIPSEAKIADADGNDVTDNYLISYQNGTLIVKGQIVCIRQNSDGTWPDSTEGADTFTRPGTEYSYTVTKKDAEQYSQDHYLLRGCSTEYHSNGSCTPVSEGQTITNLPVDTDVYLYYALKSHTLTFYADTQGSEVLRKDTVYYGASLSEYRDFLPPGRPHDTFVAWSEERLNNIHSYTQQDRVSLNPKLEGKLVDWDSLVLTEDMDVYPVWIYDRLEVQVDLGADDVSLDEEQTTTFIVNLDEKVVMRYLAAATRPGFELAGYYTQGGVLWNGDDWKNLPYEQDGWDESAGWGVTPEYCDKDEHGRAIIHIDEARRYKY